MKLKLKPSKKKIALIAHDGKKADMVAFATYNREWLSEYPLLATASTGKLLIDKVGLSVECMASGPYGGDAQIGAQVVTGEVAAVIFLVDPLDKHPHDPDIQTLMRLCNVHNIPLATNIANADCVIAATELRKIGVPQGVLAEA
jgi:methylglyoxal synthase